MKKFTRYSFSNAIVAEEQDENIDKEKYLNDRIEDLLDDLSVDIVMSNIKRQANGEIPFINRINHITTFKKNIFKIKSSADYIDLKEHYIKITMNLIETVKTHFKNRYSISIGDDVENTTSIYNYLEDIESLYEFFFIRNIENVSNAIYYKITSEKKEFAEKYSKILAQSKSEDPDGEDENRSATDAIYDIMKKKYKGIDEKEKGKDEIIIMQYLDDIIQDVVASYSRASILFRDILNKELFELHNSKVDELLLNYGNGLVILDDEKAAHQYLEVVADDEYYNIIRNNVSNRFIREYVEIDKKKLNQESEINDNI